MAVWPLFLLARAAGPADCHDDDGQEDHGAHWLLFAFLTAVLLSSALAVVGWAADAEYSLLAGFGFALFSSMPCSIAGIVETVHCRHTTRWLAGLAILAGSPMLLCVGVCCAGMTLGLVGLVLHPFLKLAFPQTWPAILGRLGRTVNL